MRRTIFEMIVLGALGFVLYNQHSTVVELKHNEEENQKTTELALAAMDDEEFLSSHSAKDVLLWALLAKEAKDDPNATGLAEYTRTSTSMEVPMTVRFRGENRHDDGRVAYTAVIGVRQYLQDGSRSPFITPKLAFYVGGQSGSVRFETISRESEYSEKDPAERDRKFSLNTEKIHAEINFRDYLNGFGQFAAIHK